MAVASLTCAHQVCLFGNAEVSLRDMLRSNTSDQALLEVRLRGSWSSLSLLLALTRSPGLRPFPPPWGANTSSTRVRKQCCIHGFVCTTDTVCRSDARAGGLAGMDSRARMPNRPMILIGG